ncbi:uncharacterized protein LOC126204170 [Schistocerca nitens]|uniref:uncharacterized protein LOC126204170 n=1 Tax=Schistocerca nitens TaxID=7011 RepID=UPI0021174C10|nr:uncharacterized protein LOC126204170 [Schistocerca nitens]
MSKLLVLLLLVGAALSEEMKTQSSFTTSSVGGDGRSVSTTKVTGPDGTVREQTVKVGEDGKKVVTSNVKDGEKLVTDVKDKVDDLIPKMPPRVTLLVVALAALCCAAPSPSPSPSLGHHGLPLSAWAGPVLAGFPVPVALPLYGGLEGALAAQTSHAFLAAPGALLALPVTHTVHTIPAGTAIEYGVPLPADAATEKTKPAVTEETPMETLAPESDKTGETSQVGGQAVGIDLASTGGASAEGETGGFSAGGSAGQVGGVEISGAVTEAAVTESAVVESSSAAPVVETAVKPNGGYKLSIAYGVPRAPTISENLDNRDTLGNNQSENIKITKSGPKIQSLDDLISETFSSTAQSGSLSSSHSGSRTGALDFVDVSSDARSLAASGGLDCTGKGCGTSNFQKFNKVGVTSNSGAFRLSLGGGKNDAFSKAVEDASLGQETVHFQNSAAVPNRAATQHYYYDLPHLAGGGASGASEQGGANFGSSQASGSSQSFASGGFRSEQDSGDSALFGSSPTSASSSGISSGGFASPLTSESLPNYPDSVPVPPYPKTYSAPVPPYPKLYSSPVPPYPNTTPVPPYPNAYSPPVYSPPAYSPPGGNTNRFAPSKPDFGTGSQRGIGDTGVFRPSHGAHPPVAGDQDGVYPPSKPPAPAYGLPQPPPSAPIDSYGLPARDLYDIRSGANASSRPSNKRRSLNNKRRFV